MCQIISIDFEAKQKKFAFDDRQEPHTAANKGPGLLRLNGRYYTRSVYGNLQDVTHIFKIAGKERG